jgi:hypothetical protein
MKRSRIRGSASLGRRRASQSLNWLTVLLAAALSSASARPLAGAARVDHEAECTYKRLTWDDFRGPVINGQGVAWISATIVLEPVGIELVENPEGGATARARNPIIYALMNKLASGAQRGGRTEENLAHEQIHFDLTEFLARRLAREVRVLAVAGEERSEELQRRLLLEVQNRFSQTLVELERLQAQYDTQTGNGSRLRAQRKWSRKAADLLASEPAYELR